MRDLQKYLAAAVLLTTLGLALTTATAAEDTPGPGPGRGEADPYRAELANSGILDRYGLSWADTTVSAGSLDDYLLLALRANQGLHQRFAEYRAANESISQVTSLPSPKLGYTEYLKPVETRVGPQQRAFSLSQSFPWFGSLSQQGEVNREKAETARAMFENTALEVIAEVKLAYYDLGYLERAVTVTGQHLQLLSQWEDVARVRYSTGSGHYTDVIKAQVELGMLSDRLAELSDQRRPLGAALNALLDREASAPLPMDDRPVPSGEELGLADLSARMKSTNPLLTAWDHRAQEFLNTDRLVKKQGKPSFTLGVNYILTGPARMDGIVDSGTDALMASVAVTLPIWRGSYDAGSRVAISRYEAALSGKRELVNDLNTALERAHFRYRDARRKVALYESALLPKGRQSLGATRTSYEAGTSSFLDLVDAQRLVLEFELSQVRAEFDVLVQESLLEKIIAGPLDSAVVKVTQ